MGETLEMPFVLSAVDQAFCVAVPKIWNSDQGSHFTSTEYIVRLQTAQVAISMDGKGRALDNIFVERLWRSVKYEEVYLLDSYVKFCDRYQPLDNSVKALCKAG